MRDKVLITGASGFVGFHLIESALQNNLEVFAAVRKSSSVEHLQGMDIKFVYPDFKNEAALIELIRSNGINYIIHAAGVTKARSQSEYDLINAKYTQNLTLAAAKAGEGFKKLVFVSSLAANGPLHSLNGIINSRTQPQPVTAYGRSKLTAEGYVMSVPGVNYSILRPTAVYGPRDKDIFIFFKQVAKGLEPYIGKEAQKLSFVYVKDLANACVKALFTGQKKIYNISDGNFYDRYELGNITRHILNTRSIRIHLPIALVKVIAGISEKVSAMRNKAATLNIEKLNELMAVNWHCDIEEAKQEMGFYPKYDLEAGLNETLKWYKANQWL